MDGENVPKQDIHYTYPRIQQERIETAGASAFKDMLKISLQ